MRSTQVKQFALTMGVMLLGALVAGGCSAPQYSFQVVVRNDVSRPITVWMTKDGPPAQVAWLSPEQLSQTQYADDYGRYAQVVQPNQIANTGSLRGEFPQGVHPVLRVYAGTPKLSQILAFEKRSPDRVDFILPREGRNDIVVSEVNGRLACHAVNGPLAAPPHPSTQPK